MIELSFHNITDTLQIICNQSNKSIVVNFNVDLKLRIRIFIFRYLIYIQSFHIV